MRTYIFSDPVPSQNSCVVTEKPLACSQGTSKYADYPLQSCMPWFINPSEQFENTQLKKKKKKTIVTSPSFLMGMQFGKGRGLFSKLHLLWVSLQEMKNDACIGISLMRWTSAGKSQRENSLREVSCQWGLSLQLFPSEFWVGAGLTHLRRYSAQKYWFSISEIQSPVLSNTNLSPTAPPNLLSCLSQFQNL